MDLGAAERLAAVLKALADPLRLRALSLVSASPGGETCVEDVAELAQVSQPTVSHHLKVLKDAGLLTAQRRGTWVFYRVDPRHRRTVQTLLELFGPQVLAGQETGGPEPGLADIDGALERIGGDLARRFPTVPPEQVLSVVRESAAALTRQATVRTHLVVTTERFARQRLEDLVRRTRPPVHRRPQVLFICVANAGRSQLAAALLQHYAGDAVLARSAGSTPAGQIHPAVRRQLAELGVDAEQGEAFPKPLTDDALRAADVVVTMGCGDTCPVLPGTRYEDWAVGDPALASPEGLAAIRADLDQRVRALLTDLVPDLAPLRGSR